MIGKRVEKLKVVEVIKGSKVLCLCDCGKTKVISVGHFNTGTMKSCGCHVIRHGHGASKKRTREYISYFNMLARCHNSSNKRFIDYGAKGIHVSEEWRKSFVNFLNDMGLCPIGMQIDRIDNSKGYSKDNCRWVTAKENMANRAISKKYILFGDVFNSSVDAAKKLNVSTSTILAWCKGRVVGEKFYPPKEGCKCI